MFLSDSVLVMGLADYEKMLGSGCADGVFFVTGTSTVCYVA